MLRKYLPAILVGVVLGSIVCNIWIVRHSKQIANKISLQQSNKQIVLDFYKAQNQHASSALIRSFFAKHYNIIDLAYLDVPRASADSITQRIAAFRKKYPGYKVHINRVMADSSQVFVWFKVVLAHNKTLFNSFALFTLQNEKIIRAVEVVALPASNSD